jgi:hypothetical protein
MTIHKFLPKTAFGPEEIERLVTAYHLTLRAFNLANRDDPTTRRIAKKIIEISRTGIEEPELISQLTIEELSL